MYDGSLTSISAGGSNANDTLLTEVVTVVVVEDHFRRPPQKYMFLYLPAVPHTEYLMYGKYAYPSSSVVTKSKSLSLNGSLSTALKSAVMPYSISLVGAPFTLVLYPYGWSLPSYAHTTAVHMTPDTGPLEPSTSIVTTSVNG